MGTNPYKLVYNASRTEYGPVINLNFSDATVWALIQDAGRQRLGIVTGMREEIFVLDWPHTASLRIEFDLMAGPRCYTESLIVDPGDLLELQIASNVATDPACRSQPAG